MILTSAEARLGIAMRLYGENSFESAAEAFGEAYRLSACGPDEGDTELALVAVRGARGAAESYDRARGLSGHRIVAKWLDNTNRTLDGLCEVQQISRTRTEEALCVPGNDARRHTIREIIQTSVVMGKLSARHAILAEWSNGDRPGRAVEATILQHFTNARLWLPAIEPSGPQAPIDQYRINLDLVEPIPRRLYGDRKEARTIAREALKLAGMSESPELVEPSTMDDERRQQAVRQAKKRAVAVNIAVVAPRRLALELGRRAV